MGSDRRKEALFLETAQLARLSTPFVSLCLLFSSDPGQWIGGDSPDLGPGQFLGSERPLPCRVTIDYLSKARQGVPFWIYIDYINTRRLAREWRNFEPK
jgi:hypothetical protein